jgi:hypothetical protein
VKAGDTIADRQAMMPLRRIVICVSMALAAPSPAAAQQPLLATVLDRASAYVAEFQRQLSGIVAEEHYIQEVLAFKKRHGCPANATYSSVLNCQGQLTSPVRTELRSDLLLVRPAGAASWTEFRDVFEANGAPVRDRTERLTKLFLGHVPSAKAQVGAILDESSRFNIGDITRNINTPLFALQALDAANRARFRFKRASNRVPDTFGGQQPPTAAFRVSVEVWIVEYRETQSDTLIRTNGRKDLPARGRFWIEPESGRILMSELTVRNRDLRATVDVSYQSEPLVGCLVPVAMREEYRNRGGAHIIGRATYGRFRQFHVDVDEKFLLKKQPH